MLGAQQHLQITEDLVLFGRNLGNPDDFESLWLRPDEDSFQGSYDILKRKECPVSWTESI